MTLYITSISVNDQGHFEPWHILNTPLSGICGWRVEEDFALIWDGEGKHPRDQYYGVCGGCGACETLANARPP